MSKGSGGSRSATPTPTTVFSSELKTQGDKVEILREQVRTGITTMAPRAYSKLEETYYKELGRYEEMEYGLDEVKSVLNKIGFAKSDVRRTGVRGYYSSTTRGYSISSTDVSKIELRGATDTDWNSVKAQLGNRAFYDDASKTIKLRKKYHA